MPGYGERTGRPTPEFSRQDVGSEINELTSSWENQLTHVYSNPETAVLLRSLVKKARKEYLEDHGWLQKMKDVEAKLVNTDDEDTIREILLEALGQPEDIGDDDEDDALVPDEDEI